ncbi:MAG: hypothetical protein HY831_05030 [Candidatus Aenigmarchaeota archaeon]|nr:hypothetical protein [Candidatus Aenigmarchaeota archaeon]
MRKLILLIAIVTMFASISFAHTVEMNFKYKISSSDDIYINGIRQNGDISFLALDKKYGVSQSGTTVAGLVFAGNVFNGLTYRSGSIYSFTMKQDEDGNRALIVLTNGSYSTIDSKYESVGKLLSTSFAYPIYTANNFPIALQLQYDDTDLVNDLNWQGQKTLQVTNEGKNDRGVVKIAIRQIR